MLRHNLATHHSLIVLWIFMRSLADINVKYMSLSENIWISNRFLTHCGLVMPHGIIYLHQHGSGNGLLPDGTKPLPEPMLTHHQWSPVTFNWGDSTWDASAINHWINLKFDSILPGTNGFNIFFGSHRQWVILLVPHRHQATTKINDSHAT